MNQPQHQHAHVTYKFCPVCGGSLESRLLKATEPTRLVCLNAPCGFVFYQDPKVAVGTIVRDDHDRVLLVRRAIEPGYGKWVFPGGYVDLGEQVQAAAIREAREEAGVDIRIEGLLNVYSYPDRAPIIIVYTATMTGGCVACDDEGLEAGFFERNAIPWKELAFRSTREALQEFLRRV